MTRGEERERKRGEVHSAPDPGDSPAHDAAHFEIGEAGWYPLPGGPGLVPAYSLSPSSAFKQADERGAGSCERRRGSFMS